jgi:ribosomal protein L32
LDDLFLCRNCGHYRVREGRWALKDHLCEECSRHR